MRLQPRTSWPSEAYIRVEPIPCAIATRIGRPSPLTRRPGRCPRRTGRAPRDGRRPPRRRRGGSGCTGRWRRPARRSLLTRSSGNDCIRTIPASGWTTLSQNVSHRISGRRLASAAVSRAGVFHHDRRGCRARAGCRRRGTRTSRPAPGSAATWRAWVLPVQPAGSSLDRDHADPRVGTRRTAGDLGGPVGAPVVDDQDLQVRDTSGRRPRPGSRRGSPPRPWPG